MSSNSTTTYPPGYLEANRSGPTFRVAIAFIVIDTVVFGLRACARYLQKTRWMWADFFMLLSLIFNLACATCVLLMVHYGAGRHDAAISPGHLKSFLKTIYYALPSVYLPAVCWSKFAILDLYLHIFVTKIPRIICWVIAAIMALNCIINLPILIWQCSPISTLWDMNPEGHCDNVHAHFTWASFPNIVTDFVMLLLPIPMIIKLQQSIGMKLGIFFTFLVGNVGLATSIVRLVEFYYFGWNEKVPDAAWLSTNVIPWCVVEPSVYHMAACFITFRPLFRWFIRDSPLSTTLAKIPQISVMSAASRISAIYMKRQSGHDYSSQTSTVTPGRDDHTSEEERKTSTDDGLKQQDSEQSADPSFAFPPDQRPTSSGYITVQRSFQVRRGVEL